MELGISQGPGALSRARRAPLSGTPAVRPVLVAHREYALSGPTLVNVMPSSVSIVSLGSLVTGLAYDDLDANISMLRNKLFASLLYRSGGIEAWGTGIGRMRAAYPDDPEAVRIALTPNTFSVTLANRNAAKSAATKTTISEKKIIGAIESGCSTRAEIQDRVGFSQTKTVNLLTQLVETGAIIRKGNSENTRYEPS